MKRGPIGVWFSLALAILSLSLWVGSMLGSAVARFWYDHHQQREQGTLSRPERIRVESELADLSAVQMLQLYARITPKKEEARDKYLANEIEGLRDLRRRSNVQEIQSLYDLNLGLAYVDAALTEEENNEEQLAKKHIQSAQVLFESLGWQNYSEETLKTVASRELEKWGHPQTKASEK